MNLNPWIAAIGVGFVIGINTVLWSGVSLVRASVSLIGGLRRRPPVPLRYLPEDVGLIMAAHNEEAVLADAVGAAAQLLPRSQIHVVSDGSSDRTVEIARELGVHVLDLQPNRGKAGAIQAGVDYFDLLERYRIVMLHDADTRLSPNYLTTGLPLFNDPEVAAVSGVVRTQTEPRPHTLRGRFLMAHRMRLYAVIQDLVKYGQASKYLDVMPICPGFASMYRSDVLGQVHITRPGLVVEDINMTFEIHVKKLGRVAFHPRAAVAFTQDPDTFGDYTRQVFRWTLGFWQTLRVHRKHFGLFWVSVALQATELLISVAALLTLLPVMVLTGYTDLLADTYGYPVVNGYAVVGTIHFGYVLMGFFLPDMALTLYAAIVSRRPSLLLLSPLFPFMRFIDSVVVVRSIWAAYRTRNSNGSWESPARRSGHTPSANPPASNPNERRPIAVGPSAKERAS